MKSLICRLTLAIFVFLFVASQRDRAPAIEAEPHRHQLFQN